MQMIGIKTANAICKEKVKQARREGFQECLKEIGELLVPIWFPLSEYSFFISKKDFEALKQKAKK